MLINVKDLSEIGDRLQGHRERFNITVDTLSAKLEEARLLAMSINKPAAAVRAILAMAKLNRLV